MLTYEERIDRFGRHWLQEHPDRLANEMKYQQHDIDWTQPIRLYEYFDPGHTWSEITIDPATVQIGLLIPLANGTSFPIIIQDDFDEIDIGWILRQLLTYDDA